MGRYADKFLYRDPRRLGPWRMAEGGVQGLG